MSNQQRICKQCQRVLQRSVHDKCLFCGEPIPEVFKLNEFEKNKIQQDVDQREKKRKKNNKSTQGSCGGGGACGGSCGGA